MMIPIMITYGSRYTGHADVQGSNINNNIKMINSKGYSLESGRDFARFSKIRSFWRITDVICFLISEIANEYFQHLLCSWEKWCDILLTYKPVYWLCRNHDHLVSNRVRDVIRDIGMCESYLVSTCLTQDCEYMILVVHSIFLILVDFPFDSLMIY